MGFALSSTEREMMLGELTYFGELVGALQDTGAYEHSHSITAATRKIKAGLTDLKKGIENEVVGPEPGKSIILDTIQKGRSQHEH